MMCIDQGEGLPPMQLMFDFLNYFNGKSILMHADTTGLKKDLFMTAKNINNERIYALVANYGQDNCSIPLENVDVHGMMLSSQTSIDYIMSCFESRQRYNKEPWILFVKVVLNYNISLRLYQKHKF